MSKSSVYEQINCPECATIHNIKKEHLNKEIKCLCGAKFIVARINGAFNIFKVNQGE